MNLMTLFGVTISQTVEIGKKHSPETKEKMSKAQKGLHESNETRLKRSKRSWHKFPGAVYLNKKINPWERVWYAQIMYNGHRKRLGVFEDPLSASILYQFILKEIES